MAAAGAVHVGGVVRRALVRWGAGIGISLGNRYGVFLDTAAFLVMQMAIMQIVDMPVVLDSHMAATRAMLVIVAGVSWRIGHD